MKIHDCHKNLYSVKVSKGFRVPLPYIHLHIKVTEDLKIKPSFK